MPSLTSSLSATALALAVLLPPTAAPAQSTQPAMVKVDTSREPIAPGKFEPTWQSLQQYEVPAWFRDAKFGIWAHWGPQCEPEQGDWYAREMYVEGNGKNRFHVQKYGHPSKFGFKDVINEFKAENWDPDKLLALYKKAGAQYFFALANHHDNLDLWDSKYQPWNSVRVGPKKDLVAGWAKAARAQGLKFGVSVHAAHAWSWYEPAQGADKNGPFTGIPYDGKLTAADGKGTWWDGLDPQDLYEQRHPPAPNFQNAGSIHARWNWSNGISAPDQAYCDRFYNRTIDLINKYQPDLLYFDDTALPLWPVSDAGLKIAAHFYNHNMQSRAGKLEAVLFGKILDEQQRKALVWDIERGASNRIEPFAWQTDTCIGSWHYDINVANNRRYKSARTVVQTLADVVSKNGNLLLSVPVRADGSIDEQEVQIVQGIADWMAVNSEAIFGTRPFAVLGEGPALENAPALTAQGFNEGRGRPLTEDDVRYTTKANTLYAIVMGPPTKPLKLKSLGADAKHLQGKIAKVELLGSNDAVQFTAAADALTIQPPAAKPEGHTFVYKVSTQ